MTERTARAARAAEAWSKATAHNRAQILYYIAENLSGRRDEFAARIAAMTGIKKSAALAEVDAAIRRLFTYGAWADKYEGQIHTPPLRGLALALKEPLGVAGVICPDEAPLLAFISLLAPLIAMGNRVIAVPSERHPLAATDFYSVLETSDVPAGVVNIVTGDRQSLTKTLAEHDDVDAQKLAQHSPARHRISRKIRIADDDVIAMPHGAQGTEHIGIESRIDRFQHAGGPSFAIGDPDILHLRRMAKIERAFGLLNIKPVGRQTVIDQRALEVRGRQAFGFG